MYRHPKRQKKKKKLTWSVFCSDPFSKTDAGWVEFCSRAAWVAKSCEWGCAALTNREVRACCIDRKLCIAATAWENAAAAEEFINLPVSVGPWCPPPEMPTGPFPQVTPPTSMSEHWAGLMVKGGLCAESAVAVSDPSSSPFEDLCPSSCVEYDDLVNLT